MVNQCILHPIWVPQDMDEKEKALYVTPSANFESLAEKPVKCCKNQQNPSGLCWKEKKC